MIEQNIDAAIQGPQRRTIALAMLALPTWLRTNVIVTGADGWERHAFLDPRGTITLTPSDNG